MPKRAATRPRSRTTKIPLRFRALGGVDPRSLPPGTPYPCNDPAVGASVRGKHFAGKVLGCATPPPGKRGRHFVVGGLESRSAIASAKRASERTREALRARYEGPDFDARPKRRAPKGSAPVAAPRPSAVKRREELPLPKPVFMRRTPEMSGPAWSPPKRAQELPPLAPLSGIALAAAKNRAKRTVRFPEGEMSEVEWVLKHATRVESGKRGHHAEDYNRQSFNRMTEAQQIEYEKRIEEKAAKVAYKAYSADGGYYEVSPYSYNAWIKARLPVSQRRVPEMEGPAWSPPKKKVRTIDEAALTEAILSQMEARGIPRSQKGAASIVSALLDHEDPEGALDTHNKNYRAIFSFFAGAKLPTTNKGTREFIQKGEFSLIPASLWGGGKADVAKQDAATLDQAYRLLSKSFLHVARIPYGPGEMPIPGQNASISEAVVTPPFVPKGGTQNVKVYVVRVHEQPGVYAFTIRENSPQRTHGLSGGSGDRLGFSGWQAELSRAIEK